MKQIILKSVVLISEVSKSPIVGVQWSSNESRGLLYRASDGWQCIQAQSSLSHESKSIADTLEEYMEIYPQDKFYEFEKVSDLLKWLVE